jgi:hypothetical protein
MNYKDINKLRYKLLSIYFTKRVIIASKRDYKSCLAGKIKELFERKTDIKETIKGRKLYCNILRIRY